MATMLHIQATKQTTLTLLERRWLKYSFTVAVCIGALSKGGLKRSGVRALRGIHHLREHEARRARGAQQELLVVCEEGVRRRVDVVEGELDADADEPGEWGHRGGALGYWGIGELGH
eukprot:scaffold123457_cov30-Phaeocystis_antarctica.AAC.1